MNMLFIIKVKIQVLIKWLYRVAPIMLTIESRTVNIIRVHSPISSFKHDAVFGVRC
jgi:hypothetical protein